MARQTVLWQLGRSGYFHPDIWSKLSFSSPVTFTPPSPNPLPRHLSLLSFTAETKSSDPTSELWPRRSVVMSALLMGGSRGKCVEPGPQCKHIKHVASITTQCQHAKPVDTIYHAGMHYIKQSLCTLNFILQFMQILSSTHNECVPLSSQSVNEAHCARKTQNTLVL